MNNKKIVIIGSTGHLGYNVAKRLLKKNKNILLLIRKKNIYTTELVKRLNGWQLKSFKESYKHKLKNGISLFKKQNLK